MGEGVTQTYEIRMWEKTYTFMLPLRQEVFLQLQHEETHLRNAHTC